MANKVNDEEALNLIEKLINGEGSDEQASKWIETLEKMGLYEISDIIFHGTEELTPTEILAKAKGYKPIQL